MENNLEFVKIDCGAVSYLLIKSGDRFSVVYSEPMKQPLHFAKTNTLTMAYDMVQRHLKGRHKCVFSLRELLDKTSPIKVGNFIGVKIG